MWQRLVWTSARMDLSWCFLLVSRFCSTLQHKWLFCRGARSNIPDNLLYLCLMVNEGDYAPLSYLKEMLRGAVWILVCAWGTWTSWKISTDRYNGIVYITLAFSLIKVTENEPDCICGFKLIVILQRVRSRKSVSRKTNNEPRNGAAKGDQRSRRRMARARKWG